MQRLADTPSRPRYTTHPPQSIGRRTINMMRHHPARSSPTLTTRCCFRKPARASQLQEGATPPTTARRCPLDWVRLLPQQLPPLLLEESAPTHFCNKLCHSFFGPPRHALTSSPPRLHTSVMAGQTLRGHLTGEPHMTCAQIPTARTPTPPHPVTPRRYSGELFVY